MFTRATCTCGGVQCGVHGVGTHRVYEDERRKNVEEKKEKSDETYSLVAIRLKSAVADPECTVWL